MNTIAKYILGALTFAVILYAVLILLLFLTSCSLSMNMVTTRGTASDVVDETTTANVKPALQIPFKP